MLWKITYNTLLKIEQKLNKMKKKMRNFNKELFQYSKSYILELKTKYLKSELIIGNQELVGHNKRHE